MYQLNGKVRYSETDANGKLSYTALLNYFQDSSTLQSDEIGATGKAFSEMKLAWVLSFWQVCIEKLPEISDDIVVSTWPYDTKNLFGMRNFCMHDANGNRLAYANSIWVLIDLETGRPIKIPAEVSAYYKDEPMLEMCYSERKIAVPKEFEEKPPVPVQKYFIDTNQHVNNANYVMVAQEYLPQEFEAKEIRVEYKKAAVLGDILYPRVTVVDQEVTVALVDESGKTYAVVLFIG